MLLDRRWIELMSEGEEEEEEEEEEVNYIHLVL